LASYHFRATIIGRKQGHSAVAAAAYRAGEKLVDERTGEVHDYSRRQGVQHTEIMLPEGANAELGDRGKLWNLVERMEGRSDAQLARSVVLALPHELTAEQRLTLTQDFVRERFVSQGMVADIAIHAPVTAKGENHKNHHAHVLLTLREATAEGLRPTKTRSWNARSQVEEWREEWANAQNTELEKHGAKARVDHRTLDAQREEALEQGEHGKADALDRIPEDNLGQEVWNMLKAGKVHEGIENAEGGYAEAEQELVDFDAMTEHWRTDYQLQFDSPMQEREHWRQSQTIPATPAPTSSNNWQTARAEQIRERLLKMELSGVLWVIYGDRSPEHFANQMKLERFQGIIKTNRATMREKRDLWQKRRALFAKHRSAYEGLFASKKLGLDFDTKHEGFSESHLIKRLFQVQTIQHQVERALGELSRQQLRLEMRQRQCEQEIAPYRREMEQNEQERPQREFERSQRKEDLEQELRQLTFGADAKE